MNSYIRAVSYYLPQKICTNEELVDVFKNFEADKIWEKTGIKQRHIVDLDECASDLGFYAAKKLFASYNISPDEIDFLVFNSQSPDYLLPSTACILQDRLGLSKHIGAFDFNLGCSAYPYGLAIAKGLISAKIARNILFISAETLSKYIHPLDKSTRTIFGDAGVATIVSACESPNILDFDLGTDGAGAQFLVVPTGGARNPRTLESSKEFIDAQGYTRTGDSLYMNGPEVFSFIIDAVPETVKKCLKINGLKTEDIDLFIFHQANKYMLDFLKKMCKIPDEKFFVSLENVGNTGATSIPIALSLAENKGILKKGMKTMLVGFGVGLSWASTIITWNPQNKLEGVTHDTQ